MPQSRGLRNRRSEVRILSGALHDSADRAPLQGLRSWRSRSGYVAQKLVSDSGRVSGEFLASSRRPDPRRPREAALALAGGWRLWRCSDKGGVCSEIGFRCARQVRDQLDPDSRRVSRRSRCRCHGRVSPNDQWSVHRLRHRVTGLAQASSLLGRAVKDCSASRFRQPPHRAPAGGARCDRGSPPAPRHVHAARDRAPARSGDVERHAALAPASPSDRRSARDSTEARGMDALALAISANGRHPRRPEPRAGRASPCVQLGCAAVIRGAVAQGSGASRLMHVASAVAAALACLLARRPFRS